MANKKKFDQQLATLESLRQGGVSAAAVEELRKALLNRNNYIVAKAAKVAAHLGVAALVPDLTSALDRFYRDPAKSDPQCWAKHALVEALAALGYGDPAVFLRGLRHVQMEPVWGGQEDTAARLRAGCALALVQCRDLRDLDLLSHLLEALADPDKTVRMEGAHAVGLVNCREGALLLRLRALVGDKEPEVIGACFSALLSIEGGAAADFVAAFLRARDDIAGEAALALGAMRTEEALRVLRETWQQEGATPFGGVLLAAIALTRLPQAFEFLAGLVERDSAAAAAAARALDSVPLPPELRARIDAAVGKEQGG